MFGAAYYPEYMPYERLQEDIVHPVFRQCAENVIRKLLEHTAKHPCVIGFQIDNETKHYGTASPQVQAMFSDIQNGSGRVERTGAVLKLHI